MAMAELRRVASYLNLPSVVRDEASRVYNYVLQRGLVRGRSMESVIAACIYAACRSYNIPRTLDEIAAASDVVWTTGSIDTSSNYRFHRAPPY